MPGSRAAFCVLAAGLGLGAHRLLRHSTGSGQPPLRGDRLARSRTRGGGTGLGLSEHAYPVGYAVAAFQVLVGAVLLPGGASP